jgi:hypothetical protein
LKGKDEAHESWDRNREILSKGNWRKRCSRMVQEKVELRMESGKAVAEDSPGRDSQRKLEEKMEQRIGQEKIK